MGDPEIKEILSNEEKGVVIMKDLGIRIKRLGKKESTLGYTLRKTKKFGIAMVRGGKKIYGTGKEVFKEVEETTRPIRRWGENVGRTEFEDGFLGEKHYNSKRKIKPRRY